MDAVRVSPTFRHALFVRQTPGRRGEWGGFRFSADDSGRPCHAWFVYEGLQQPETALCARENTVFVCGEPSSVRRYHPAFLKQFGAVLTSQSEIVHPGRILGQQGLGWLIGTSGYGATAPKAYDDFKHDAPPAKTGQLAVICSNRTFTPDHARRLTFVRRLAHHFGDRLDVFGSGLRPLTDKWDGIAPYRYCLALENSAHAHYWTEKLADVYLGWGFPLYWGCPNIADYFPEGSFARIDRDDLPGAIRVIEQVMATDTYERALPAIAAARELVLDRYNTYAVWAELAAKMRPRAPSTTTLLPESVFEAPPSLARQVFRRARAEARALSQRLDRLVHRVRDR